MMHNRSQQTESHAGKNVTFEQIIDVKNSAKFCGLSETFDICLFFFPL